MNLALGSKEDQKGCLTRLIDVVNKEPSYLEDLVGFHRGRLSQGYHFLLLLKQRFEPEEFEFFGYTYMSGGKIGIPSRNPVLSELRPSAHDMVVLALGKQGAQKELERLCRDIQFTGEHRYVKIVPVIPHNPRMNNAYQYPASKHGIPQFNLLVNKRFLVAAKVLGDKWSFAGGTSIDVGTPPRYDRPYAEDPCKRVFDYLSNLRAL